MGKSHLPESLRQFVERRTTMPVTELWKGDGTEQRSPYGTYWYRAVAYLLLWGRIQAKFDGPPHMTDVNRLGKEANFNRYLTRRIGTFLVAMGVIQFDRQNRHVQRCQDLGFRVETIRTAISRAVPRGEHKPPGTPGAR
jgi:hypothetical protein